MVEIAAGQYNIDDYIFACRYKNNISPGGLSADAYDFGDVVLIKYTSSNISSSKCGPARKFEEYVAASANEKRNRGVNTPYHLGIKREETAGQSICWVLQEKVKGKCFSEYFDYSNILNHIENVKIIADAPDDHYDKWINDLCELFNLGLEWKSKNIYYDENDGFSIIDLCVYELNDNFGKKLNFDSEEDILKLFSCYGAINNAYYYDYSKASISQRKMLKNYGLEITYKLFLAMKRVIPNFERYEGLFFRSKDKSTLDFFEKKGVETEKYLVNTDNSIEKKVM